MALGMRRMYHMPQTKIAVRQALVLQGLLITAIIYLITFSPLLSIWSITLVSTCIALCAWMLGSDVALRAERKSTKMKTTTSIVVNISDMGTNALASITCVIMAAFHAHLIARVYSKLVIANAKLNITPSLELHSPHLIASWQASIIIVIYTSFLIVDFIISIVMENNSYMYTIVYIFHYITFSVELQVALIAKKIKYLFNALNAEVSTCFTRSIIRPYVLPPVEIHQGGTSTSQVRNLKELSDLHWNLCTTVQDINTAFGVQLVSLLLSIFAHIIITPYFFFLALADPETYGGKGPYLYLKFGWMALYSGQLCMVVVPCAAATVKAGETATVLCKYLNADLPNDIENQAESFLIQLLHHDANFSACELFNINLPVITSVASAVTTYLVILIQFQNSDTNGAGNNFKKIWCGTFTQLSLTAVNKIVIDKFSTNL